MLMNLVAFGAGLLVGWNLFPQPEAIKNFWAKLFG